MEPLQLSKDQKGKLLEMCKILFTNYADIVISGLDVRLIIQWEDLRGRHTKQEYIPWFEMCMTQLATRLLSPQDMMLYQTTGKFLYEHPVVYLYEKFKKLKK